MDVLELMAPEDRLPHQTIHWYSTGTTDLNGEWHYSGRDEASIKRGHLGNRFPYEMSISPLWSKSRRSKRYAFSVRLTDDYLRYKVGEGKAKTKREARQRVIDVIQTFERSDRFLQEVWPRMIAFDNVKRIVKRLPDGTFQWIASTVRHSVYLEISPQYGRPPFGEGEFWFDERSYDWNKPASDRCWRKVNVKSLSATYLAGSVVPNGVRQAVAV